MKNFKIWCETEEEKQKVLLKMEKEGIKWLSGHLPTQYKPCDAPIGFIVINNKLLGMSTYRTKDKFESYNKREISITPEVYTKEKR